MPAGSVSSRSPELALREVGRESAGILTGIHSQCFPNYWNLEAFSDFFSVAGTRALLVEEEGGAPVAIMVFRLQHEQADIITICVLPAWRRHGIARLLLTQAMRLARQGGVTDLFLDVEEGNAAAIALYQGFGFTQINRRRLYYRQKDGSFTDALVMTCKLA